MTSFVAVKDSGERQTFSTGSVRDTRVGKGRFDLLSPIVMLRDAQHMENGAVKYGDRNWELGQPLSRFADSAMRHLSKALAGQTDEDHWSAARWNIACIVHIKEMIRRGSLPKELDDLPNYEPVPSCPEETVLQRAEKLCGKEVLHYARECGKELVARREEAARKATPRCVHCCRPDGIYFPIEGTDFVTYQSKVDAAWGVYTLNGLSYLTSVGGVLGLADRRLSDETYSSFASKEEAIAAANEYTQSLNKGKP